MKVFVAIFIIFSIFAITIHSAPINISENNIGDIVNVNVDAEANIRSEINVNIISIILNWINTEIGFVRFEDGQPVPPNLPWLNTENEALKNV